MRRRCCGSGVPKICTGHATASQKRYFSEFGGFRVTPMGSRPSSARTVVRELTTSVDAASGGSAAHAQCGGDQLAAVTTGLIARRSRRAGLATTRSCLVEFSPTNRSMRPRPRWRPYECLLPNVHILGSTGIVVRLSSSQPFERILDCKLRRSAYHGASNDEPGIRGCAFVGGNIGG